MHPHLSLPAAAALTALLAALVLSAPAQAYNVQARASQNPNPGASDINDGALAYAEWPPGAWARATRTQQEAATDGLPQSGASTAFAAQAAAKSAYDLWDLGSNTALSAAQADSLDLVFHFQALGHMTVDPVSLSVASIAHGATLYSQGFEQAGSYSSVVYGPMPGGPGYLATGDGWYGDIDTHFTLTHRSNADGILDTSVQVSAAHHARSSLTLSLNAVTLGAGTLPSAGLGIRLRETGEILVVSAVPEPGTWALWAAGLAFGGWRLRVRQRAR
ncbi:MAG: hypothetical protein IV093_05895 [Rubrivivax sp.]|nr:hypothetical protein [Rubrivivax sp.]